MTFLARLLSWGVQKLTFGFVLAVAGLGGFGLWLYARDHVDFEQLRQDTIRQLTGETGRIREALRDVEVRIDGMQADLGRQQARAKEAARLRADLESENSGLSRLANSREQVRTNAERIARLRDLESAADAEAAKLTALIQRAGWERDGLQVALGRTERLLQKTEQERSRVMHYVRRAWESHGRYVVGAVLVYFVGPPLWRVLAYFLLAPFISARRAVRIAAAEVREPGELPQLKAGGGTAVDIVLEPGDVLWVKEAYLQASDEGLLKRTRWLLDWRMPFTCLATGLRELVEMRNAAPEAKLRATFSSQADAHVELAVVAVPAGASLVLRPSYLAGMLGPLGRRETVIRKHWRVFSLQSWATGQFRYFEFVGPCTLLLAGSRGVRAEVLEAQPGLPVAGRRANQDATIGFTPGLAYRPVRAETFWAYFRGQNPLFDDLFEGRGVFLCQQTSAKGEAAEQRRALQSFWSAVGRIFGL
jgi:hypothetical protein